MLSPHLEQRLRASRWNARSESTIAPKHGEEIFNGGDWPRSWDQFVGQNRAVAHLKAVIKSAKARGTRLDHILLSSGLHGVGKSSLGRLIAAEMGVGLVEMSGVVSADEARPALRGMEDGDILFYDEIHLAVSGGKSKAEWMLHLLQDGGLMTAKGFEKMPSITVVAATTDAQKLPRTLLSRFSVQPVLEPYRPEEAARIAEAMAGKMKMLPLGSDLALAVAEASNCMPREMKHILVALRDVRYGLDYERYDLDQALEWVGVTRDGLTRSAQDYLLTLLAMFEGVAGEKSICSALNEPGGVRHTEQLLAQKGFIEITSNGRRLTTEGQERTEMLIKERGLV